MPNFTKDAFAKTEARLKAMEDAKAKEIEYIPVDQAGGAPQTGTTGNYRFQQHGDNSTASASVVLHGERDSRPYRVTLTVTGSDPAQALDKLMSGIATAKRLYALSPFEPVDSMEPVLIPARPKPAETELF